MKPLSIGEANEIYQKAETEKDLKQHFKKFEQLKAKKAKELREELEKSEIIKLKPESIAKIIDILPKDAEDLNKIFVDVSLDKDETEKLLEIVKKYT